MAYVCPGCGAEIPDGHLNISQGMAECPGCHQFFPYEILTGAGPFTPFVVAKPPGCKIASFRDAQSAGFSLPPLGVAGSGGVILIAFIWNAFIGFAMSMMLSGEGAGKWLVLPFMLPFVAVGVYLAVLALFSCYGTASLLMDKEKAVLEKKLFGKSRDEQEWMISELRQFLVSIGNPAANPEGRSASAPPVL